MIQIYSRVTQRFLLSIRIVFCTYWQQQLISRPAKIPLVHSSSCTVTFSPICCHRKRDAIQVQIYRTYVFFVPGFLIVLFHVHEGGKVGSSATIQSWHRRGEKKILKADKDIEGVSKDKTGLCVHKVRIIELLP